jgi:hypothetical protein
MTPKIGIFEAVCVPEFHAVVDRLAGEPWLELQ